MNQNLLFTVFIDGKLPNTLRGDEIRVRQILLNILNNAAKYTKEGFVSLSVVGKREQSELILEIVVSDTGIGIKEEDLTKLFEKFSRLDAEKNRSIEGTGLGLSIAGSLCKMMGGDIKVASVYGQGTTFTVTIPQEIVSRSPMAKLKNPRNANTLVYEERPPYLNSICNSLRNLDAPFTVVMSHMEFLDKLKSGKFQNAIIANNIYEEHEDAISHVKSNTEIFIVLEFDEMVSHKKLRTLFMPVHCISIANAFNHENLFGVIRENDNIQLFTSPETKILIVDDIATNLKVLEGLLSPYEMQVDACLSGEEAISMVKKKKYDIVFMDQMMPGIDGIEATKRIRAIGDAHEKLTIIAQTANAVLGVKEMLISQGFSDYISKPVEISKLHTILETWIPKNMQKPILATNQKIVADILKAPFEIPNIDVKSAINYMKGNKETYLKLLDIYARDVENKLSEIPKYLDQNNLRMFITCVHALKSSSAYIGANAISEMAKMLEDAGNNRDLAYIEDNTVAFLTSLDTLRKDISALLQRETVRPTVHEDTTVLRNKFELLKLAIAEYNVNAIDEILLSLEDSQISAIIEQISQCVLISDFDNALSLVNKYLDE